MKLFLSNYLAFNNLMKTQVSCLKAQGMLPLKLQENSPKRLWKEKERSFELP